MKWIGIHGASESGKDTAADFIIAEFGGEKISFADPMKHLCRGVLGFTQEQLWGPSKNRNAKDKRFSGDERAATCAVVRVRLREQGGPWISQVLPHFGPDKQIEAFHALQLWLEDCLRQDGLTPRYALQTLGTEWGRAQDPEMWFKYAEASAIKRDVQGYCVVADCRFLNEGKFMQSKGAPLIEVLRPGFDGGSAMAAGVAAHQSEMERVKNADAFRQYITHTIHNDSTLDAFKERIWGVLSPEVPWPKATKPSTVPMSSTITVSDTVTLDSSPSTSSTEEATPPSSPRSTPESSTSSPTTPTDTPKKPFGSGPKTTSGKTGGSGHKTGRKS